MRSLHRIGGSLAASLVLLGVLAVGADAVESGEERRGTIESEVSELEESIDEVGAEEQAIQRDLEETQRARAELDAQFDDLDGRVADERAALTAAEQALDTSIARHLHTQGRLSDAQQELARSRRTIEEQAITAYMSFGAPDDVAEVYLEAADLQQLLGARALVDAVASVQGEEVEQYRRLRTEDEELVRQAEDTRSVADTQRVEVATRKESVEALRDQVAAVRDEVAEKAADEARLLAEVQTRKVAFEQRVTALRQESDAITEWLRVAQVQQVVTPAGAGQLGSPLVSARQTSAFGYRVHPIFGSRRLHAGVDFGASSGTPILAAGDGTVVFAGVKGGYGNTVVIDHGGAIATLYAHQSKINVTAGAPVIRGQVIGNVGSTGNSTGPHLHFEVRVNGTPVDPRNYL